VQTFFLSENALRIAIVGLSKGCYGSVLLKRIWLFVAGARRTPVMWGARQARGSDILCILINRLKEDD